MLDDLDHAHVCEILERHDDSKKTTTKRHSVRAELPHYTVSIRFENEAKMFFTNIRRRAMNIHRT